MLEPRKTHDLFDEQITLYRDQGFLIVPGFLPAHHCDRITDAIDTFVGQDYRNYLNLHDEVSEVGDLLLDRDLLRLLDRLQNHRMIPIGSIFFFCKPGNPLEKGSVMHQDNYAPKSPYGSYLVASIAFDDADASNGALAVCPGTHKFLDLDNVPSKNFEIDDQGNVTRAYSIGNEVQVPGGHEPITLTYKKGDLLLLHAHTVHGAQENTSDRCRRQIYMHFIKNGDPFWPGWNANRKIIDRPECEIEFS
ncbi:MAG: phytanoyl-CoA dioxygenase family protein [Candidatus Lindowbacteria bacterium]|nr:phytanoyl-CoA dioxygenase family protein [Candidatus Lindowbacteria bacterium]